MTVSADSNADTAAKVIALAKTKLGDKYTEAQSGRLGPNSFDCSGFVYYLYKTAAGITLNGTVTTTEEKSGKDVALNALQPGDLLFYGSRGSSYHVGLYEGNGMMIHAATPAEGVRETALKYYEPNFARRIIGNISGTGSTTKPTTPTQSTFGTNVHYAFHKMGGSWLSEVTNFNSSSSGYTGGPYTQNDMLYIKVDQGSLRYRVHTTKGSWLPWVSKGDRNDLNYGAAGVFGQPIDGVQLYYNTPSGKPYSEAFYRTQTTKTYHWSNASCDDGTSIKGYPSYSGNFGQPIDHLQIGIAPKNPF
ncbi:C40 family peptidase [Lactiplantibacillus herbarum]|uniref:C40 family peptidase n=1 Tax=Lactiplantibacillus herbarum TaxID=1670446 RepID=UPI00069E7792|nr:C40 family peptidase [Lactiplantibacillus herbarum]